MVKHMRTTIVLGERLHAEAKVYAARHRITLTQLIEEALRTRMQVSRRLQRVTPFDLPTFAGDGLHPGLSLDEMGGVYDAMDRTR